MGTYNYHVRGALRLLILATIALAGGFCALLQRSWMQTPEMDGASGVNGEFHFLRLEYTDLAQSRRGWGRGWWRQDWPEADIHFTIGLRRLTRMDVGEGRHVRLTDDRIFDYPWIYATQVGYWDLSRAEIDRLREYLDRGGFLVTDDFWGPEDWEVFRQSMQRVFPERQIVSLDDADPLMRVVYEIKERTQIPGLRHLRRGPGGRTVVQPQPWPPQWQTITDEKGRILVAVNFNMDIGDAWEHADMPEYPEEMTSLAYRFGINYIVYSMTH
jgi:hypothetical protein